MGDEGADRSYDHLLDLHVTSLRNLHESMDRIAQQLLRAALRYDEADDNAVITGEEQP